MEEAPFGDLIPVIFKISHSTNESFGKIVDYQSAETVSDLLA